MARTQGTTQATTPVSGAPLPEANAAPGPIVPPDAQLRGHLPITELSADEAVLHVLNRLGYGPRPGDLGRVKNIGLEKWIGQQLNPTSIDDSALTARLSGLPATTLSAQLLLDEYPDAGAAAKKMGITVEEYRKRNDERLHPPAGVAPEPSVLPGEVLSEMQQAKVMRAVYSERQLEQQLTDFWLNHFNVFANKDLDLWLLLPYERDVIAPRVLGNFRELLGATAESPAMLFYLDNHLSADPRAFDRQKRLPPNKRPKPSANLPPIGGKRGLNENYGRELMELHTLGVDGGYSQQDVIEVARAFTGWTIRSPRENPEFYYDDRLHDPDPKRVLGKKIHAGGMKDGEQVLDLLARDPHTAHRISLLLAQHFVSDTPPETAVARMAASFKKSHRDLHAVMQTMIDSPEFWSREAYRAKVKTPFELVISAARAMGTEISDATPLVNWVSRIGQPLYQCVPPTGYADKAAAWVNSGALLNRMNYVIALASKQVRGSTVELPDLLGAESVTDPYQALEHAIDTFLGGQITEATRGTLEKASANPQLIVVHRTPAPRPATPAPPTASAAAARPVASTSPAGSAVPTPRPAGPGPNQAKAPTVIVTKEVNLGLVAGLVLGSPEFQRR